MSNLLASLGHTGRRRIVLGHTMNTVQCVITKKSHTVLSKFMFLCWAAVIAILSHMWPVGHRLNTPDRAYQRRTSGFHGRCPLPFTLKLQGYWQSCCSLLGEGKGRSSVGIEESSVWPRGNALGPLAESGTHLSNAMNCSSVTITLSRSEIGSWLLETHSLPVGQRLLNQGTEMNRVLLLPMQHWQKEYCGRRQKLTSKWPREIQTFWGPAFRTRLNKQNSRYLKV